CDPSSDPGAGAVTVEVSGLEGGLYHFLGFTPASKCAAGKIRAAGKKGACLLRGYARQARRGEAFASDPACTAKLSTTFAALDARGGCKTTRGNAGGGGGGGPRAPPHPPPAPGVPPTP